MKETWDDPLLGTITLVRNARARHIIMRPVPTGVRVTCPLHASVSDVQKALDGAKEKLLERKKDPRFAQRIIDTSFSICTDLFRLSIALIPQNGHTSFARDKFIINRRQGECTILCPPNTYFTEIQEWLKGVIINQLRHQAKLYLPLRTDEIARMHGFRHAGVKIQSSKTCWGSCSARNSINLSLHLMALPSHLIDYVIKHELCHTVHHDHSPKFWALMDSVTENKALELRRELKSHNTSLV